MNKYTYILLENLITLSAFVSILVFAPGAWKLLGFVVLLNLTALVKDDEK